MTYGAFVVLFTEKSECYLGAKGGRGAVNGYHLLRTFVVELIIWPRSRRLAVDHTLRVFLLDLF